MSDQPGSNRPIWEAESNNPELAEKVKEGLSEVIDPEIGLNVIQLGLIRDVHIEPDSALIPAMIEAIRQKAESVLNRPTNIDLGMEMWDFSMMEEGLGADWGLY